MCLLSQESETTQIVSLGLYSDNRTQGFGGHFYMYFSRRRKYNKSRIREEGKREKRSNVFCSLFVL
jgi:hypothetical protein